MNTDSEGQRAQETPVSGADEDRATPSATPSAMPPAPPSETLSGEVLEPDTPRKSCRIIAIGASAGGLEPFETFFENVRVDTGFAFVVIQHLSPHFRSMMDELLDRRSTMRIRRVEEGMEIEPDVIYLNPPRTDMKVKDGRFVLERVADDSKLHLPINTFLTSLAREQGEDAVAIVLSGTGSDGTLGAEEIRTAGGIVLIQDPGSSKFDGMPTSVLDSMNADAVAPPKQLAAMVSRLADGEALQTDDTAEDRNPRERIFRILRDRYATDFSHYKSATIDRRLSRRVELGGYADLEMYSQKLATDEREADSLYADLLIEVTDFFRDGEGFEALRREVVPRLIEQMQSDRPIRVWVPGCASGEEAYSIAILIAEYARTNGLDLNLKVIATDIHHRSLEAASAGRYSPSSVKKIPRELRDRYFVDEGDFFSVHPTLQRMVVFSVHNILSDPPFTRIDLVSCRNLLIYFNDRAQQKVLAYFHFALIKGGFLFLAPSETVGALSSEFDCLDHRWHIFRKRRNVRLTGSITPISRRTPATTLPDTLPLGIEQNIVRSDARRIEQESLEIVLRKFAPPGFLIKRSGDVVRVFGDAGRFVQIKEGRFSQKVVDLVRPDLCSVVTTALDRIRSADSLPFERRFRIDMPEEDRVPVTIKLESVADRQGETELYLLTLREEDRTPLAPTMMSIADGDAQNMETITLLRQNVEDLERELQGSEETLQSMIEELATSNEEMQATNEELMASNEELQSTNEELHSVNEELYTVSAEHQRKIVELTEMSGDMEHLLRATGIGTIFVDADLSIRRFTPAATRAFNILKQDIGRPVDHITNRLGIEDLPDILAGIVKGDEPVDREFALGDSYILLRMLPYMAMPDEITGVVLMTIDVTDLKRMEQEASRAASRYESIVRDTSHFILRWNAKDEIVLFCNDSYRDMTGLDEERIVGHPVRLPFPEEYREQIEALKPGEAKSFVLNIGEVGSKDIWCEGLVSAIGNADGTISEFQAIGRDVSVESAYRVALEKLSRIQDSADMQVDAVMDDLLAIGSEFFDMPLGIVSDIADNEYTVRSIVGGAALDLAAGAVLPLDKTYCRYLADSAHPVAINHASDSEYADGEPYAASGLESYIGQKIKVYSRVVGAVNFASPTPRSVPFDDLEVQFIVVLAEWIGRRMERREALESIRRANDDLQFVLDSVRAKIWYKDDENIILRANKPAAAAMGISVEEAVGANTYDLFPDMAKKYHVDDLKVIESGEPMLDIIEEFTPLGVPPSWVKSDKIPYIDPITQKRNLLVVSMDITALKQQEQIVNELNRELAKNNTRLLTANHSLEQFAHVASHDLQEPLRKLMQFTEYLSQDCGDELSEDGRYFVEVISNSARRMRQLVRDILLLSSASGKDLKRIPVDLRGAMRDIVQELDVAVRESGATVEIGTVPTISADPTLTNQLFHNLMSNALKYRVAGTAPHIEVGSGRSESGQVEIRITDNGIGIRKENLTKVFEPFARLHDRKQYDGTGIGLAICRTVCERHGWTLHAKSDFGNGSTFVVTIPEGQVE